MKLAIQQQPELPANPLPIVIIGAGGIVRDAHLPAYQKVGFPVLGLYDVNPDKSAELQAQFPHVQQVYPTLAALIEAGTQANAVFDVAVPASKILEILRQLPDGSGVLIQKPMGETLAEAKEILQLCREKRLVSALNFQLRYAPYMIAARDLIDRGLLGKVYDLELSMCVYTPWHLWDFLFQLPRMEILYHSVHYLDLIRSFWGSPEKIYARTIKHPKMPELASTKTSMILDYGEYKQARVLTNHGHEFGLEHQHAYFKIEGTKGAIQIQVGVSLDYPRGKPARFEYYLLGQHDTWQELPLSGGWFPDAFIGTMAGLQQHILEPSKPLLHSTEDAFETMRLVEAAYHSSESGGTPLSSIT